MTLEKTKPRPRGTGGLVKKEGSRNWYALWWQNGKQFCRSTGTQSKMQAEAKLQEILGQKAIGKQPVSTKLRYEDLRDALVQNYQINDRKSLYRPAKTDEPRLTSTKHLDEFFGKWKVRAITTDAVNQFVLARKQAGQSNGTINRSLSALKKMFTLAIKSGKIQNRPYIEMLKEPSPRKGFLEYEDFLRLRRMLPERLQPLVTFLYATGARLGEARKIQWSQVDLTAHRVRIEADQAKNQEARDLPLPDELVTMLKQSPRKTGPVFYTGMFRRSWASACVELGFGRWEENGNGNRHYVGLTPHDMRRSAVRNLREAGVAETTIMKITGHKTQSVFRRYSITTTGDLHSAMNRLEASRRPIEVNASPKLLEEGQATAKNDESSMKIELAR